MRSGAPGVEPSKGHFLIRALGGSLAKHKFPIPFLSDLPGLKPVLLQWFSSLWCLRLVTQYGTGRDAALSRLGLFQFSSFSVPVLALG